jgi:cytochrome c biogenesis protein CcdA
MCIVFVELFMALRIRAQISEIFRVTRDAMSVMASSELDDDAKEARVRHCSLALFKATFLFLFKFLAIAAALATMYYAFLAFSPDRRQWLNEALVSIKVIVLLSFIAIAYVYGRNLIVNARQRSSSIARQTRS